MRRMLQAALEKAKLKTRLVQVPYPLAAGAGLFIVWGLIQTHSLVTQLVDWLPGVSPVIWFLHLTSIILLGGITWFMVKHCTRVERHQMIVLMVFILAGLLFFGLYEQTYGSWIAMSDRVWTVLEMVRWTTDYLSGKGIREPRLNAEILLADVA